MLAKMQSLEYISLAFNPELEARLPFPNPPKITCQPRSLPCKVAAKLQCHVGFPVTGDQQCVPATHATLHDLSY